LEEIEIEKRRLNLVIMGLKAEDRDDEAVKDLSAVLTGAKGVSAIGNVERIGMAHAGRARPLRVTMTNTESRYDILQACSDLRKHEKYKKVYIVPDLTRKQQENDKVLRDKLKDLRTEGESEIRIKKGKIIKLRWKEGGTVLKKVVSVNHSSMNKIHVNSVNNVNKITVNILSCWFINAHSILNNLNVEQLNMYAK